MTSKKAVEFRKAVDVLCALYDVKVPVLKQIVREMVINGSYSNSMIALLHKFLTQYSSGENDQWYTGSLRILGNFLRERKLKRLNRSH